MADNMNDTNQNLQSNINIIDDASDENLIPLTNQSRFVGQDDDVKESEPVSETAKAMANEGTSILGGVLQVAGNTATSNLSSNGHDVTTDHSLIEEMAPSASAESCIPTTINQPQSQINNITTNNGQQQSETRKHIMISYNRATATPVCQRMYDRLTERGYTVWFDRKNLTHGSILDAMGNAIDNAFVVLVCLNEGYSKSDYAPDEAKYAREKKVPIIPCMMEEKYSPRSGLGIIACDRKYIEFFDDNKFDESFEELISQINAIEASSGTQTAVVDNTNFHDRFNTFMSEHMQTVQNLYRRHRRRGRNVNETELWAIFRRFIQEFSPETWQSFQNDSSNSVDDRQIPEEDNDRLLRYLLVNNERLEELIRTVRENHEHIEQYLIDQDERLAAFQRFQQQQRREQEHLQLNSNEQSISLFRIEETQQQGQERNDIIIRELEQRITQLTELVINQTEQHARVLETMHQLVNQSLEASSHAQQQLQQVSRSNFNLLKYLIQTTILLCTLAVLFKNT